MNIVKLSKFIDDSKNQILPVCEYFRKGAVNIDLSVNNSSQFVHID